MKCICGATAFVKETRGNDYVTYRIRTCKVCGKEFVTKEEKMDTKEGLHMIRKIFYRKYIKPYNEKKKKGRRS